MTGSLCLIIRQRCIVPDNFGEKTLLAIYCYLLFNRIRWILIPGIDYRRLTFSLKQCLRVIIPKILILKVERKILYSFMIFLKKKKKKRTRDYYERTSCQIFEKHLIWMIPRSISTLERIVWRTETDG